MIRFLIGPGGRGHGRAGAGGARLLVAAAAALGALAGCGSGTPSTTATTAAGGSGSGSGNQGQLNAFASSVKAGEHATYKAVYTYTGGGSNAATGTVTIEQKPPKTLFKSGATEAVGTGPTTYFCSSSGATPTCLTEGTGSANPLAGITQLFNPESAVTAIQAAEAQVAAHVQGYDVSFSTQSFAGADANCVTVSGSGQTGKYCVTKSGILAYGGTGTSSFALTTFSTSVADSDFSLPPGATVVTIPGAP